jgi:hypothetical protein
MEPEQPSTRSVAPPGFAMAVAGHGAPKRARSSRGTPEIPWSVALAVVALVAAAGGAYLLLRPAPVSDATQARSVINDYEHSILAGHGAHACALLTTNAQGAIVALAHKAGRSTGCVASMGIAGAQLRSVVARATPAKRSQVNDILAGKDVAVSVDASHTQAIANPYGTPITLVKTDGHWLIDSPKPATAAKPAHLTAAKAQFAARADAVCRVPQAKAKVALAALVRRATTGAPIAAASLAAQLHTVDTLTTPMFVTLHALRPPAGEAAAYAGYLKVNGEQLAVVRAAQQLAAAGHRDEALAKLKTVGSGGAVDRDAATLGFQTCD